MDNLFQRGSEWRMWDLHIHIPETLKNDTFSGTTPDEKWGGKKSLQELQKRDGLKRDFCKANNIQLIEIRYDQDVNEVLDRELGKGKT